jgi:hypothetical protein
MYTKPVIFEILVYQMFTSLKKIISLTKWSTEAISLLKKKYSNIYLWRIEKIYTELFPFFQLLKTDNKY